MKTKSPHLILQKAFKKRQKDIKLSLRGLAKNINVSPSYLSKLLTGKKNLNVKLIEKLSKALKMDTLEQDQLLERFKLKLLQEKVGNFKAISAKPLTTKRKAMTSSVVTTLTNEYELAAQESEWILSKWYYIAILDLVTVADFTEDSIWIAKKLLISTSDVQNALKALERNGLIYRDDKNRLIKKYSHLRFPARLSKEVFRNYHIAQMKRAIHLLDSRHAHEDFSARLITGLTVASNKDNFEKVKNFLHQALYQAAEMLSEGGPCSEVYQINLQLYPHTTKSS